MPSIFLLRRVLMTGGCISKNLALGLYPSSNVFPLKKTMFRKLALIPTSGKRGGGSDWDYLLLRNPTE
jgi:hypothetical protein